VKLRTWPIILAGFGTMVLLTVLFALDSWRRADEIYDTMLSIHESHGRTEDLLRDVEAGIYLSGLLVRDFLLDPSHLKAAGTREDLIAVRSAMESNLTALVASQSVPDRALLDRMRTETDAYWDSLDPVFEWTPQQKSALSALFLRKQVLPRRDAALNLAGQVKALATADFKQRQLQLSENTATYRKEGRWMLVAVLVLAIGAALGSILRISRLEYRAQQQRLQTEQAEKELRRLSQKLVHAQEDESRRISRELHDEVGQMLTALRVELGNLDKLRHGNSQEFTAHLEDAKSLAIRTLHSVRNLASGLRPSVLDDLGLGPALQSQAREFSRRTGVPVEVVLDDLPVELSDAHRTCIYRVVQEALTNCARHARAQTIRVALHTQENQLSLTIQDDGRGLSPHLAADHRAFASGLGLVGIEERVRELAGSFDIQSQPGKGTLLKVSIPIRAEALA
jgi:signal transduction histidine kinase